MKTVIPAITFRIVRGESYAVERGGKRIGSLVQNPANAERNASRWVYWPEGESPWPSFATFDEAKSTITENA